MLLETGALRRARLAVKVIDELLGVTARVGLLNLVHGSLQSTTYKPHARRI
jgi:hypothetical protein